MNESNVQKHRVNVVVVIKMSNTGCPQQGFYQGIDLYIDTTMKGGEFNPLGV